MTNALRIPIGEPIYVDLPQPTRCPTCETAVAKAIGVVVDHGIYNTHIVTLIDQDLPQWERLCCSVDELDQLDLAHDGIIHAAPENVAAAVTAGWLEPGSEFYGCHFRIATAKEN